MDWQNYVTTGKPTIAARLNDLVSRIKGRHEIVVPTKAALDATTGDFLGQRGAIIDDGHMYHWMGVTDGWVSTPRLFRVATMADLSAITNDVDGDSAYCSGDGYEYKHKNGTWVLPFWTTSRIENFSTSSGTKQVSVARTFPSGMNFFAQNGDVGANAANVFATNGYSNNGGSFYISWSNATLGNCRVNYFGIAV